MEARTASFYFSFMVVSLADSKLVIPALQIFVESLVGNDSFLSHVISLICLLSAN